MNGFVLIADAPSYYDGHFIVITKANLPLLIENHNESVFPNLVRLL